ncbi:MAG: hypothetical protein EOM22_17200 [Gammaproteobacteria bacterium]|jgi:predicted ArsR family transcriptional regulator|nr:hypothetical protein [Gammaproteobacteria bacterium]
MLDRRSLLATIRRSYEAGDSFTTADLARQLGAREYAIRACVSWLTLAGALAVCGSIRRRDRIGRPYIVKCYRVTGRDLPAGRIKQDRVDREVSLRLERDRATRAAASAWLSRSWSAASP